MLKQRLSKIKANPLREALYDKGYTFRDAAEALGINQATLNGVLRGYDPNDLADRIRSLPARDNEPVAS